MWDRMIFGYNAYQIVLWFLTYSILGWFVESIYMSICNRKLTNRGFVKGPICPIYGVGALTVFFILKPYSDSAIVIFILGALLATTVEFLTAGVMIRTLGGIWWDYREKPFNFKGILCLESSLAWGVYTLALFAFLHKFVVGIVEAVPVPVGRVVGSILLFGFSVDFLTTLYQEKKDQIPVQLIEFKEMLVERILK